MHATTPRGLVTTPRALASTLLLILWISACSTPPTPNSTNSGSDSAAMPAPNDTHVVLVARGMACPKCVTNADLQLMKIQGVRGCTIDMKHGFITVEIDPAHRPSREAYAKAIDAAGLTLVSVHESPKSSSP